jgi:hypothetical protein
MTEDKIMEYNHINIIERKHFFWFVCSTNDGFRYWIGEMTLDYLMTLKKFELSIPDINDLLKMPYLGKDHTQLVNPGHNLIRYK